MARRRRQRRRAASLHLRHLLGDPTALDAECRDPAIAHAPRRCAWCNAAATTRDEDGDPACRECAREEDVHGLDVPVVKTPRDTALRFALARQMEARSHAATCAAAPGGVP